MTKFNSSIKDSSHIYLDNDEVLYVSKVLENLVEWEKCDCGCNGYTAANRKSVVLLRCAAFLRTNLMYEESVDSTQASGNE